MHWVYLFLAILFENAGTTGMKLSQGFTRTFPSVAMAVCYAMSIGLLTLALKKIEMGVAYAIWSGLGTAVIALIGILWFRESANALKLASLGLIIVGVVGLNLSGAA